MQEILNIYKSKGLTSFDVVQRVRRKFGIKKVGHAGTLDPLAEGVLVVLLREAVKKQEDFKKLTKEYRAKIALGFETDTDDLEGEVINKVSNDGIEKIDGEVINKALRSFVGKTVQKVPLYSAVKINGTPVYELARKGKITDSELPSREVEIYSIELISLGTCFIDKVGVRLPVVDVKIVCGSGTYIRSLARDLGRKLGAYATLVGLIRTKVGDYKVEDSIRLESL